MFLFLVVYFLTSSTPPPGNLLNLFIAYSNKLKRKLLLLIKKIKFGITPDYFFLAGAACPGFGRLAPYLERL